MYIPLRNHTTYSLCKGAIRINELISKAKEYQMPALGIMDSGNLFAALEFSMACKKESIQPILGCEMLVNFKTDQKNISNLDFENSLCKLPLIAANEDGYKNLMYLASYAFTSRKNGLSPHVNLEEIAKNASGLIALTGAQDGVINKFLADNQDKKAKEELSRLIEIFGAKNLYIELERYEDTTTPKIQEIEKKLIKIAFDKNIPLVATNDVYFLEPKMHEAQDILSCIGDGRFFLEKDRKKYSKNQYFKKIEEIKELFKDIPEAIENTVNIAKRCHVMANQKPPTLPIFDNSEGFSEREELKKQSHEGLNERLAIKFKNEEISGGKAEKIKKEYFERIDYELSVIANMGFDGYFLIVSDFIKWSKSNKIPVGPGRGSGAGSVVAWALQITDLDPIRFGLLFERFLNPERVSMPDFDIDFCQAQRDKVIEYVQNKYDLNKEGEEKKVTDIKVAQIITFGKLQARAVLKDVGRVLQIPYGQVDRICKLIPFNALEAVTLEKAISMDKDLQRAIQEDEQTTKLTEIALKLEGLNRHSSTHAAGIVIGDKPLTEICALYLDDGAEMPAVGYSMKYAENAGLVKFDFLGLKTLTTIDETVKLVEKTRGIKIDITNIKLDDKITFDMLALGDSIGVFQIESSGMRSVLKQMKCDKIEDIIALISLYRPGPMDNIPTYVRRKHGEEKIAYPHPILEPILKETYGVIVYQEQVMEIAKVLAGYSLGAADLLRRAMGKKIKEEMDEQRKIFREGAIKNGVDARQAEEIFDLVDKFAGYGFNKSHAAAYAFISYQTAYLKAHYPAEFLVASANLDIDNAEKINVFLQVAKSHGIKVLPPDVNSSEAIFSIEELK